MKQGIEKAVDDITREAEEDVDQDQREERDGPRRPPIAANNDREIGKLLADAMEKVGKDGVITVDEGKSLQTETEWVEGMQFDRGYLSPYFVTDPNTMTCVLEDAYVLVYEKKITQHQGAGARCSKPSSTPSKPLLIVCEEVEGEALATLVINKLRGTFNCCAVKAPGYGDRRKAMLEDIAILTGGQAIFEALGIKLENLTLNDLGRAKKMIIDKDNTTIIEGAGKTRRHQGPHRPASAARSKPHQRLRSREARRAARQAVRRRGQGQRRRRDRERNEGEEGPRRRRPARHPCSRRRKASCPAAASPCCEPHRR